jgi:Protein of unknown function (DUF4230)
MGVLTPERERTRPHVEPPAAPPPPPPPPPTPERPRRRFSWNFIAVGLAIVGLVVVVDWARDVLPDFNNPFAERTVDRSPPPVLAAIVDLGEYRAVAGNYELLVDLEKDTRLPSEILGTRTLFVAVGSVDAGIDFSQLDASAVDVSQDGNAVTITLPHAQLYPAEIDLERSYTYERDEGIFNRIENVFAGGDSYEREVMVAAERKLNEAAAANGTLARRAEQNTARMLETFVRSLGFERVTVRFA